MKIGRTRRISMNTAILHKGTSLVFFISDLPGWVIKEERLLFKWIVFSQCLRHSLGMRFVTKSRICLQKSSMKKNICNCTAYDPCYGIGGVLSPPFKDQRLRIKCLDSCVKLTDMSVCNCDHKRFRPENSPDVGWTEICS